MRHLLSEAWALLTAAQKRFSSHSGGLMAGSVAFFASLSLIPLGLLLISALGHVIGSDQAFRHVEAAVRQYFPGSSGVMLKALDSTRTSSGRWLVDVVGTFALLWSGMNLFTTLSMILSIVWAGEPKRSFFARKAISFLAVIAAGLIFLASALMVSVAATFRAYASSIGAYLRYLDYVELLNGAMSLSVQAALAASFFFALYRLLPAGRVMARGALAAAVPAALLWIASRSVFSVLVVGSSRYGQLYGPLAGAVVLLLWIYYSAYIMIFCAELGAAAQERYWTEEQQADG